MAPIPKDTNKEKPPNEESSEIDMFSNPNLVVTTGISDSSDDDGDDYSNIPEHSAYTLLSQEPGDDTDHDDDDNDGDNEWIGGRGERTVADTNSSCIDSQLSDCLPDEVIQSEMGTGASTVPTAGSSSHPSFLAKFPDGQMPSYMQVSCEFVSLS